MNFYQKVKQDLLDTERRRGLQEKVAVDSKALRMLLEDYEKIETFVRATTVAEMQEGYVSLHYKLHEIIKALYTKTPDAFGLIREVMEIITPIEEIRRKLIEMERIFYRS